LTLVEVYEIAGKITIAFLLKKDNKKDDTKIETKS
jgi:hypothetical protein